MPCKSNFRLRGYHTNRGNVLNKSTLSINHLTYSRLNRVLPGPYDTSSTSTHWDRKPTRTGKQKKHQFPEPSENLLWTNRKGRAIARSSPYSVKQMNLKRCPTILIKFPDWKLPQQITSLRRSKKPWCEQSKTWIGTTKFKLKCCTPTFHSNHRIFLTSLWCYMRIRSNN